MILNMAQEKRLSIALVSLGCPKSLVDSEKMLATLAEGGCIVGAPMERADVIVVNTCGFLAAARDESLEVIHEALARKASGPARRVVVAGCLVNRDAKKLYELAPGIDAIVGVHDRRRILSAVTGSGPVTMLTHDPPAAGSDSPRFRLTQRHTAYLRISEGCSRKCTFCTIPAIRGPFRSKGPQVVLAEARELIADGAVELNIIGQDTTAYGRDLAARPSLACLLRDLGRLEGVRWVRLMYAYPMYFTDKLITCLGGAQGVAPYVDLPLQHISDAILRAMGRGVGRRRIENLLGKLRQRGGNVAIRTTFIVGFPGETDSRFEELLAFIRGFRFDALGVFEFSAEEGTAAAKMPAQVPADVKAARAEAIMLAQQEIVFDANSKMVGKEIELLVDGIDGEGRCIGRHAGQAPDIDSICYLTEPRQAGTFVRGIVLDWDGYDLIVEPR